MKILSRLNESLKKVVFGINFALVAFICYVAKMLYFSPSLADAPVFIPIVALYAYDRYLSFKKPDPVKVNTEIQAQINEIQKSLRDVQMAKNIRSVKF